MLGKNTRTEFPEHDYMWNVCISFHSSEMNTETHPPTDDMTVSSMSKVLIPPTLNQGVQAMSSPL